MTNAKVYQWFHDNKKVEEHWVTFIQMKVAKYREMATSQHCTEPLKFYRFV